MFASAPVFIWKLGNGVTDFGIGLVGIGGAPVTVFTLLLHATLSYNKDKA